MTNPQSPPSLILPPATIGILGSGQLGRMLAISAKQMGYRVAVFSPSQNTPTGQIADEEITAPYEDEDTLKQFAKKVAVITYEFENVPAITAELCAQYAPVRPGIQALYTAQHRHRENHFFTSIGAPTVPYHCVNDLNDLHTGLDKLGGNQWVLKTATAGYDGKGQIIIQTQKEAESAWLTLQKRPALLEQFVSLACEVSVVAARGINGKFTHFGIMENTHKHHILDVTVAPANISPTLAKQAIEITHTILEKLEVIGVMCVEFFITEEGQLYVNEIAPRPHNSGHLTIDACVTNQFEQQLRAICGLPLGDTSYHRPAAMANLLGDLWQNGTPHWQNTCTFPDIKLHLYGKDEARIGRKMGHLTALAETPAQAQQKVLVARNSL